MTLKATKQEIIGRYVPALTDLSKVESITGKIAYNCGRTMQEMEKAINDIEKARITLLESRAEKDENGKAKTTTSMREERGEDGTVKMVPNLMPSGQPVMKYVYESQEKEWEVIIEVNKMEATPVEINIYSIPASEILSLKSMKDGGNIVYRLGDIIDHER